jgi:hypothetical protein
MPEPSRKAEGTASVVINSRTGSSDNASMPPVSMTLDDVARSCARSRSNHSALLPADQASAYRADDSADNRALSLAVVMSVGPPVSHAVRSKCQHNKNEHQQHRDDVLFSISLYHFHSLLLKESPRFQLKHESFHTRMIRLLAMSFLFTNEQIRKYTSPPPVTQLLQR